MGSGQANQPWQTSPERLFEKNPGAGDISAHHQAVRLKTHDPGPEDFRQLPAQPAKHRRCQGISRKGTVGHIASG